MLWAASASAATKKGMVAALALAAHSKSDLQAYSFDRLTKAVGALLDRAVAAGEIKTVNYDPSGSGAGRATFIAGGSAFAGSDSFLKDDELAGTFASCAPTGTAVDLPVYISPIAVVFNVEGVTDLNFDSATLAKVFKGDITLSKGTASSTLPAFRHRKICAVFPGGCVAESQ